MDAANAFGSLIRSGALWNARVLWTRCSRFLFNSYRGYALLIIKGTSVTLLSKEGVTQGVPSSMKLYAIGLLPLTQKLKYSSDFVKKEWELAKSMTTEADADIIRTNTDIEYIMNEETPTWSQFWYADDSLCIIYLRFVLFWMKLLICEGPKYGYYPEPDKSYLVVSPKFVALAKQLFSAYGVTIIEGGRVLGGFVGSKAEAQSWGANKVQSWVKLLKILSEVPRVFPDCEDLF